MENASERLYHISDQAGIELFEPRVTPASGYDEAFVWAIDWEHLPNYLLPRDCPRVTFFAIPESSPADVDRFFCGTTAKRVIVVESAWLPRILGEHLYRYEFDADSFELIDEIAGYYVSREAVTPVSCNRLDNILTELLSCDIELRIIPSLWKLRDAIVDSTLGFSIIRMNNAQPPMI